jgi:UDP-N-acetylmuramate: L-alanyl-gamma-D-glutamyl-meso-diaminopimelate ligase
MKIETPLNERLFGLDPLQARDIHLTGVCGAGMGAMARLLKDRGYHVRGSDEAVYPPMSDFLREWGIPVREGFKASNLDPKPDLVIVGNVVSRRHEEAEALLRSRIPYLSFPEAVRRFFLDQKHPIAVCGTHGKTTTTGLLAWIFRAAGKDPGFFFGGIMKGLNVSSHCGEGDHFIIEGDEYDTAFFDTRPKFVHYIPEIAIVNGIEFDHADLYKDLDEMKRSFSLLKEGGGEKRWIIFHGDDPHCREIYRDFARTETFGLGGQNLWSAANLVPEAGGTRYHPLYDSKPVAEVFLPLWGRHNVLNSLAAFAAASKAGLSPEEIGLGLQSFPGMKRRQEIFYSQDGVDLVDDFAHHPTAVKETINAVRSHNPQSRILAVYEPRSNTSRSNIFQEAYERSFDGADEVVLYKPIQKNTRLLKESPFLDMDILSSKINDKTPCKAVTDREGLFETVAEKINARNPKENLIVLIMSNGKFEGIYKELPKRIKGI